MTGRRKESQRHILQDMFASASRPFYQSTQTMPLNEIPCGSYHAFASKKMAIHHQDINEQTFQYLYDKLYGHTWYIQMLLNRLYESDHSETTTESVDATLQQIADENEATYQTFLRLVTPGQGKLLKTIAAEGTVEELLNQSFISTHHLGATSSVKSAAKALVEKELLLDKGNSYQIYDRFFGIWLKKHLG